MYTIARFTRHPFWHGTRLNLARCLRLAARHPPFCRVSGKIRGTSAPKHTGAETTYPHGLGNYTAISLYVVFFSIKFSLDSDENKISQSIFI